MNTTFHEAMPSDVSFMQQMLYIAAIPDSVPTEYRPTFDRMMTFDWVNRYVKDWGREDDLGLVISEEGLPVGAAWYRRFESVEMRQLQRCSNVDLPPHELAIGLVESVRGKRIGSAILGQLLESAEKRGVLNMCLSVNADNTVAERLYRNAGFEVVGGDSKSKVMLWSQTTANL